MIDDAVGKIMAAAPDAMIIFTSDHGLSLGHHGFWGHGGATWPSNLHRAAHSIPLIIQHANVVKASSRSSLLVSNTDLYATLLDYVDGTTNPDLPSRSFANLLKGEDLVSWGDDEVYAEQERHE